MMTVMQITPDVSNVLEVAVFYVKPVQSQDLEVVFGQAKHTSKIAAYFANRQ